MNYEGKVLDGKGLGLSEKRSLAEYIQRWGHAASIALFDPTSKIFGIPEIDGIIGYRVDSKSAIVFGDPVCASHDIPQLTQAFHDHCQMHGKNIVYVAASEQFTDWAMQHRCRSAIGVGHEIIIDPECDPKAGSGKKASNLRNKYNQSIRQGIVVKEYREHNSATEQAIEQVASAWLKNRKGPQIFVFSQVNIFADRSNKRWFYAEQNGHIIGLLLLNRIDAYHGWVVNMLMVTPQAPRFTSELIVLSALDVLREEDCHFFSIGTTPAPLLGRIEGLGRFSTWIARKAFKIAKKIFQLDGRQKYWEKFQPRIEPTFLLLSRPRVGLKEILSIMRALNVKV